MKIPAYAQYVILKLKSKKECCVYAMYMYTLCVQNTWVMYKLFKTKNINLFSMCSYFNE